MAVTERNHYLPQFYLRGFLAQNAPKIFCVYDKKENAFRPQTPINTGIERHLYNLEQPDGTVDDTLETQVFAPIESVSKPVIDRLLEANARLVPDDIETLAWFLAFMATRVPRSIRAAQEMGEALVLHHALDLAKQPDRIKEILAALKQQGKLDSDITVAEAQEFLKSTDKNFKVSMNEKFAMGMSLLMTQDVFLQLLEMNWCLCRAPSGSYFICSDMPLVSFVLDNDGRAMFGGGLSLPSVQVTFPISPEKCLYLDRKQSQRYRAASKAFVREINRRTAWAAERFIISTNKTKYVQELCTWASRSIELPKLDKDEILKWAESPASPYVTELEGSGDAATHISEI
jgi:hypothetical protein